ncbi:MAG: hypothetical protein IPG44_18785 [Anaerolineales bacterium]|nr:hypothetical protein [Anaerolineales bacterium]
MDNQNNSSQTNNMNNVLLKLANFSYQFDPESDIDLSADLQQHLIMHTFANLESEWNDAGTIQSKLEEIFTLKFENVEVIDTIKKLKKQGKIEQNRDNPTLYKIHYIEKIKIIDITEAKKDLKLRVIQEWFNQIEQEINRPLTSTETKYLNEDIEIYFGLLAAEGGAQAIKSAFAEENSSLDFFSKIEKKPKWKKREDDKLYKELRNEAIQIFLKKQTDMRRKYVFQIIESTFFLSLLHIDPTMSSLAKSALNNKSLYLDSNIIYRLLGLQTESLLGMTKRVIEASKEFGCKLFVSQLSIDELKVSLRRAVNYLEKHPPLARDYERLKLQYTGESRGFIIAYWKEYEKNGTALSHFANKYSNIDKILTDEFGIQITSDFIDEVSKNISTRAEISGFAKYIIEREQGNHLSDAVILPGELPRNEQLLIHDVRLLKIVEKARGKNCSKFAEADFGC